MVELFIMKNANSLDYFSLLAKNNPGPLDVKVRKINDHSDLDAAFIKKYINKTTSLLDLASGSGLIINQLNTYVKKIVAVELFSEFSKYIKIADNITIVNCDITQFSINEQFDLITMFGIVQYFNEEEILDIYQKYYNYLNSNGKIIIKGQFAVNEDVMVEGYSEQLKTTYYSHYRNIKKEISLLNKNNYKNIKVFDIYPSEFNHWGNTHFYAIVGEK